MPGFFVLRRHHAIVALLALLAVGALLNWAHRALRSVQTDAMADFFTGRVVVIDPGHGGPDPGSVAASGLLEKDVVLDIGLNLRNLLLDAGATVVMTREDDRDISGLTEGTLRQRWRAAHRKRLEIAESSGADVVISLHANSVPSPRWFGAQTFYAAHGHPASSRLAEHIQRELRHITGGTERTISNHVDHFLLNNVSRPAVIVEVGFLSNPREADLLAQADYRRRLAWAVFIGVAHYFAELHLPGRPAPSARGRVDYVAGSNT